MTKPRLLSAAIGEKKIAEKKMCTEVERIYLRATPAPKKITDNTCLRTTVKVYTPLDTDDEEDFSERGQEIMRVIDALDLLGEVMTVGIDDQSMVDFANQHAGAPIVMDDDTTILADIDIPDWGVKKGTPLLFPAGVLLKLETNLNSHLHFTRQLPTLQQGRRWQRDSNGKLIRDQATECYITEPHKQNKTRPGLANHIIAPATKEHPQDTRVVKQDELIGHIEVTHISGELSEEEKSDRIANIEELIRAVKYARSVCNTLTFPVISPGAQIAALIAGKRGNLLSMQTATESTTSKPSPAFG